MLSSLKSVTATLRGLVCRSSSPSFLLGLAVGGCVRLSPFTARPFAASGPHVRRHSCFSPAVYGTRAGHPSVQHFSLHHLEQGRQGLSFTVEGAAASRPSRHPISGMSSLKRHSASSIASTGGIAVGSPHNSVRLHSSVWEKSPRFDGVHLTVVNSASKASVLQQELSSLLQKGAIEEVPQLDVERGFFSRHFLVPKRDGGLRPILDLRRLNFSLYKGKFKMLTIKTIMSQVQEGDWFVTIDLKDAYFHIQVIQRHRRFLRFAFGGKAYQYKVLPFGLALAPRTFTKCIDAALAPLRLQGIRVLNYLDDWLILAHSRELVSRHRDIVLGHIHSLGLRMNAKKSVLLPSQRTVFLGVRLHSVQMQARLAPARISDLTACLVRFKLGHHVSVGTCRRLLGLMAAAFPVLRLGLLHMRPFLWWMKELRLHPTVPATRLIGVSRSCCRPLLMWRDPIFLRSGVRMGAIHRRHMITTDASMTGWGAVFEGRPESGEWKEEFLSWHINCLELRAAFLALKYFLPVWGGGGIIS